MTIRLAAWSGPRNISTALMRSWENRPDTVVLDEPFYASYLHRTGLAHPAREAVIASQSTDPEVVVAGMLSPTVAAVQYSKQMAHHLPLDRDLSWLAQMHHVLVIRDPAEVVASYVRSREACAPDDIGLLQQHRLLAVLPAETPVIDAADFLRAPGGYLRWLCGWLDLDFTDAMLAWPAGPRDSDGVWAPHWYDAVERSTGFEPWRSRTIDLSPDQHAVAEACRPAYDALRERRLLLG